MRGKRLSALLIVLFLVTFTVPAEAATTYKDGSGDLNDDNKIDILDIIEMIRLVLKQKLPDTDDIRTGDMDMDRNLGVNDLMGVVRIVVRKTCSDGTPKGKCSITRPKYCNSNGMLEDDCTSCGCSIGYECQADGTCLQTGETRTCTDSDGGKDFYSKGTTFGDYNGNIKSWEDYCEGNKLYEFSCLSTGRIEVVRSEKTCESGCSNGICTRKCSDGTPFSQCSVNKPWLCQNGELIEWCWSCGCDQGDCQTNGKCSQTGGYNQTGPYFRICTDGTPHGVCSQTKPKYCTNGTLIDNPTVCGCPAGQELKSDGTCGAPAEPEGPVPCRDSDGGKDYDIRGKTTGINSWYNEYSEVVDGCAGGPYNADTPNTLVLEYYCENGKIQAESVRCDYGCMYGACVAHSEGCDDSDGGNNYEVPGAVKMKDGSVYQDICKDSRTLKEYSCKNNLMYEKQYVCPDECSDGACKDRRYPGETELGRFATMCGAVNVHTENGTWATDPDCVSGCDKNDINYCRKLWPGTTSLRKVTISSDMKPFNSANCYSVSYYQGQNEYACIKETSACSDTDGKNYDTMGIVSHLDKHYRDACKLNDMETKPMCFGSYCLLTEYYCDDSTGNVAYETHTCPSGCRDGKCENTIPYLDKCADSDNGLSYNVKGITIGRSNGYSDPVNATDSCSTGDTKTLWEYYCIDDYVVGYKKYSCPYRCENGRCIEQEPACSDTDGDKNYETAGSVTHRGETLTDTCSTTNQEITPVDVCAGNECYLAEYFCSTETGTIDHVFHECQHGCSNGACNPETPPQPTCDDSDEGKTYDVYGSCTDSSSGITVEDSCSGSTVRELFCNPDYQCRTETFECEFGCENGACVKACSDGTRYGQCSSAKPKYCNQGTLENRCQTCGCPSGMECQTDGTCKTSVTNCQDGTPVDECSQTKPKYCNLNGLLENNCRDCGCPPRSECKADGSCQEIPCADTDGGTYEFVKGTLTYNGQTRNDYCNQEKTKVNEFFCERTDPLADNWVDCEHGCENGECLSEAKEPDLTIESINLIDISTGYLIEVSVKNSGNYQVTESDVKIEITPSQPKLDAETNNYYCYGGSAFVIPEQNVMMIPPLTSVKVSESFNPVQNGQITVKAMADPYNDVAEKNENNNILSKHFSVYARVSSDKCPNNCNDGTCKTVTPTQNAKNPSKYSAKEVFLISDKENNWKDIMSLVPVTTWSDDNTEGEMCPGDMQVLGKFAVRCGSVNSHLENGAWVNDPDCVSGCDKNDINYCRKLWPESQMIREIEVETGQMRFQTTGCNYYQNFEPQHVYECVGPVYEECDKVVKNYPTIVYHEEATGIDVDSVMHFIEMYSPDRITIASGSFENECSNGADDDSDGKTDGNDYDCQLISILGSENIQKSQIKWVKPDNHFSYWSDYLDVVYVDDVYENALMAATYASLINAPLIIQNHNDNIQLSGRRVTCVGNLNAACDEKYSLEQLQRKYIQMTGTDKIILVNPSDLTLKLSSNLTTEKSGHVVSELYSRNSMVSPILASAKHEVIVPINSRNYETIGSHLEEWIGRNTPGIINNQNGVERDNKDYPAGKVFVQDLSTGDTRKLHHSSMSLPYVKLTQDNYAIVEDSQILFVYDLNSGTKSRVYLGSSVSQYVGENGILYYAFQMGSDRTLNYYDFRSKTDRKLKDFKVEDDYIVLYTGGNKAFYARKGAGRCTMTGTSCNTNADCGTQKYCSSSKNPCSTYEDCNYNSNEWCIDNACGFEKDLYVINIDSLQERKITSFSQYLYQVYLIGGKIIAKVGNNLEIIDENTGEKETLAGVSTYWFENGRLIISEKLDSYSYRLSLYDPETKAKEVLMDRVYYYRISVSGDEIVFDDLDPNAQKHCQHDGKSCSNSLDCSYVWEETGEPCTKTGDYQAGKGNCFYQICIKGLYVYDISTGEMGDISNEEFSKNYITNGKTRVWTKREASDFYIYGYLTVMGSEKAIPLRENIGGTTSGSNFRNLDLSEYADIYLDDRYPDMAVGRIQGITVSDVSSYVARDLFYESFPENVKMNFLASIAGVPWMYEDTIKWANAFRDAGYDSTYNAEQKNGIMFDPSELEGKQLLSFKGHGSSNTGITTYDNIPYLDNTLISVHACNTCSGQNQESYCNNAIRNGALMYFGATSTAWASDITSKKLLDGMYKDGMKPGQAMAKAYNYYAYYYMGTLLGDPALDFTPKYYLKGDLSDCYGGYEC